MTKEQALRYEKKFKKMNAKDTDELPYTHYLAGKITITYKYIKKLLKTDFKNA